MGSNRKPRAAPRTCSETTAVAGSATATRRAAEIDVGPIEVTEYRNHVSGGEPDSDRRQLAARGFHEIQSDTAGISRIFGDEHRLVSDGLDDLAISSRHHFGGALVEVDEDGGELTNERVDADDVYPTRSTNPMVRGSVTADRSSSVDHIRSATATIWRRNTVSRVRTKAGSHVSVKSEYSFTMST